MKQLLFNIICILLGGILFFSCMDEEEFAAFEEEEGLPAWIDIDFSGGELQTKATGLTLAEERKVESINLFIFDRNGRIVTNKYFSVVDVEIGIQRVITTSGSNMSIYAIANLTAVNVNYVPIQDNVRTVTDLTNLLVYTVGGDVEANRKILMWGVASGITIPPLEATITVPITLQYVASKVHVNLINNVPAEEQVSWTDWKLLNYSRFSYLVPRSQDAVNPANASDYLSSTATFAWTDTTFVVNGASKPGKCAVFYLFENRQGGRIAGAPTDTDSRNKNLYAPAKATALVANGIYQKATVSTTIKATIYFGGNSYNDYNLERGKEYTYQVTVKGINEIDIDSRVDGSPVNFQANVLNTTLDCHYDWRPLRLGALNSTLSIQILDALGLPATSTFWLKVSSINLNQFVNNGSGTFIRPTYTPATDMKTQISGITFTNASQLTNKTYYLYADEYLVDGGSRSATVRVSNGLGTIIDIPITQKGYQTMGMVGLRKFSLLGAVLPISDYRLAVENVEESGLVLTPGAVVGTEKTYTMQWGFADLDMQDILLTTVFDYYKRSGYENTYDLVYQPATSSLWPPYGRIGGGTISESIHNPIFNTYAARYCFEKNRDIDGDGKITGSEVKWYLPSKEELILVYAGEPSLSQSSTEKLSGNPYYSSTEYEHGHTQATYSRFDNGKSQAVNKKIDLYVRCVRAVTNTSTTSPYVETLTQAVNNQGFKSSSLRTGMLTRPTPVHLHSDAVNKTVAPRFVVAKADVVGVKWAEACGWTSKANTTSTGIVASPATGCQSYWEIGYPAGTWRVPTQRELYLLYLVRKEFVLGVSGLTDFLVDGTLYWTSTSNSATEAWGVDFEKGSMGIQPKTAVGRVRCIRDL